MHLLWWKKNPDVDRAILHNYEQTHAALIAGELDFWREQIQSRLALIILADQFSRNMYRGDKRAFAQDPLALSLAVEGTESGLDEQLRWIERVFFYMPFEHSESLAMQEKSVQMYRALARSVPEQEKDAIDGYIDFAVRHLEIISRFGRFPHRNAILGRDSSEEEIEFLLQPGSSF